MKFGKTKQKEIALITTALKALLSVAKTNGRLSRCKLNTGNVYNLFLNVLIHILPPSAKKVRNRSHAPKNVAPIATTQIESQSCTKRQSIRSGAYIFAKKKKGTLVPFKCKTYSICVVSILYHNFCGL